MAGMFKSALQRMASSPLGQIMPVTVRDTSTEESVRMVEAYELQWTEGYGVDPKDVVVCKYRVRDPVDIARIKAALERRQSAQSLAAGL